MLTTRKRSREALSRADAVVVLLVGLMMAGVSVSCVQKVRYTGPRFQTTNNMKQVTFACHSAQDTYKKLPPAFDKYGAMDFPASLHVHLLPFVEQDKLYKRYLASRGDVDATNQIVPEYIGMPDPSDPGNGNGIQSFAANLRIFSDKGLKTRFASNMPAIENIEPGSATLRGSITDGTSNTVAFATKYGICGDGGSRYALAPATDFAAYFGQNAATTTASRAAATATYQLRPGQEDCLTKPLMAQSYTQVLLVGLADGSTRMVSPAISPRNWNLGLQPNDGLIVSWE